MVFFVFIFSSLSFFLIAQDRVTRLGELGWASIRVNLGFGPSNSNTRNEE